VARALTDKQEKFCQLVVELSNKAEAYRQAYDTNASAQICAVEAQKLMNKPNIALRIQELREMAQEKHNVTVESLMLELEEARDLAKHEGHSATLVSATMAKAKLVGLDKQIIETTIKIKDSGENPW